MEKWNRIRRYEREALERDRENIRSFINNPNYPAKCHACYIAGIRSCLHWIKGFKCGDTLVGEIEDLVRMYK